MKIFKILIIYLMFGVFLQLATADSTVIGSKGFISTEGIYGNHVLITDAVQLDPNHNQGESVQLIKSVSLSDANQKKFKKAKVLAFTTSSKRMKISLVAYQLDSNSKIVLASRVLPRGLKGKKLIKLQKVNNHTFNSSQYQYALVIDFMDGAASRQGSDFLGFVGMKLNYR